MVGKGPMPRPGMPKENLAEALRERLPELEAVAAAGDRSRLPGRRRRPRPAAGPRPRRPRPRRRGRCRGAGGPARRRRWPSTSASPPPRCSSTATRSTSPAPAPRPTPGPARCRWWSRRRRSRTTSPAATSRSTRWRSRCAGAPALIDPTGVAPTSARACCASCTRAPSSTTRPGRRAARYAARFGFEPEPETAELLRAADLGTVSADRRQAELLRLAADPEAARGFELLAEWGLVEPREGGVELAARVAELLSAPPWEEVAARDRAVLAAALGPTGGERGAGEAANRRGPPKRSSWRGGAIRWSWRWPGRWAPSGWTATSPSGARSRWRSAART